MHIEGNLDLTGCIGLTKLPENLYVGGMLRLNDCTNLTSLPESLKVGEILTLDGCSNLTSLPKSLEEKVFLNKTDSNQLPFLTGNQELANRITQNNIRTIDIFRLTLLNS